MLPVVSLFQDLSAQCISGFGYEEKVDAFLAGEINQAAIVKYPGGIAEPLHIIQA